MYPYQFIIEGVDRLGKSTLIGNILNEVGYRLVVHYDKPKRLKAYEIFPEPLLEYQFALYAQMFNMIENRMPVIFDRGHLGELVYAPMYRKYDTSYISELETYAVTASARLILLTTSDFSFIEDDGLSIDFAKKEEEQARFIEAFNSSLIEDKLIIDVSNGKGSYKSPEEILAEALRK